MRLPHSMVLAFIGWYLMMPPMVAELDLACVRGDIMKTSTLFSSMIAGVSPREFKVARCHRLARTVDAYAPMTAWPDTMSTWRKIGEFATLAACQSQYEANQSSIADANDLLRLAASELIDEGLSNPSDRELQHRAK